MPPPNDRYFVSPTVDAFFMGGASILCFLFYRFTLRGYGASQVSGSALWLSAALLWVGNWPHFSATSFRLYLSPEHRRQFALTAWLVPALIALATGAALVFPVSFAPYFLKLFLLWSPYHFSAQSLGITLIYARRTEFPASPLFRRALTGFFLSSFLVQCSETETSFRTAYMYAMAYPQLNIPAWTPAVFQALMYGCLAVAGAELFRIRKAPPWILALPVATQYLWFVFGAKDISFQLLIPFFHALQYLLIAWSIDVHARSPRGALAAIFGSARWFGLNFAAGAVLFFGVPRVLAAHGWNLEVALLLVTAGLSLHHYFVDGVIWKLRQEKDRSPLFRNVGWALEKRNLR